MRLQTFFTIFAALLAGAVATSPARACETWVRITYLEETPDLFVVQLNDKIDFRMLNLQIDMNGSRGRAFVDTLYGASDYRGDAQLSDIEGFEEGTRFGTLSFKQFNPGQSFTFAIDLDDISGDGDHIEFGELEGATGSATLIGPFDQKLTISGAFDARGVARLMGGACL